MVKEKYIDSQQIAGALLQPDLSKFPAGTRVVQVGPPLIIDIPDNGIEDVRNSEQGLGEISPYDSRVQLIDN